MKTGIKYIWLLLAVWLVFLETTERVAHGEPIQGMVSYWWFDEGKGTVVYDSIGTNHGTIVGDPVWTSGQADNALDFNGASDYVQVSNVSGFETIGEPGSNVTIAAWIRKPTQNHNWDTIVCTEAFRFQISDDKKIRWEWTNGRTRDSSYSSGEISLNEWCHVVATKQGNNITFYINGNLDNSDINSRPTRAISSLEIGKNSLSGVGHDDFFDGAIDELMIFDRALTATEIQQIYQWGLAGHGEVVSLEIIGPEEVFENSSTEYKAVAQYEDGYARNVTAEVFWQVESEALGSINDKGVLTTQDLSTSESIIIHAQFTAGDVTLETEMMVQVWTLVGLEITGPENVNEYSSAQYKAVVYYDNGYIKDVTDSSDWSVQPEACGSVDTYGVLHVERVETPDYVTVYAQYTEGETVVESEKAVQIFPPVEVEITGPESIKEYSSARYKAEIRYDNGHTKEVTSSAIWSVEPETCASIDADGVLHTERIDTHDYITVYAQYTAAGTMVESEKTVQVFLPTEVEIIGPPRIATGASVNYKAIVHYNNDYDNDTTRDITDSAVWWIEPDGIVSIDSGLLQAEQIDKPMDISLFVQYPVAGTVFETELAVRIVLPGILNVPSEYETIQAGIDATIDGDEVVVAPGTYTGPGNRDIEFLGKAITVRSTDPNDPNIVAATIIDCQGSREERHHGFSFHNNEDANSILAGLTVTNAGGYRAAIYCENSSPTITNCIITNNNVNGISCRGGSPTIVNCVIVGNTTYRDYRGGGISCFSSNPIITNCIISGNVSGDGGGGINCRNSSPIIVGCTITQNKGSWAGGGIACYQSSPKITNCLISRNVGKYGGGGISCSQQSNLIVTNSVITTNAAGGGGAIYCEFSDLIINNCVISGNSAVSGAGILSRGHRNNLTIRNCTITDNVAEDGGGGINCSGTYLNLGNSILWNNKAGTSGPEIELYGRHSEPATASIAYSDIKGGQAGIHVDERGELIWGQGNIDEEPLFESLGFWDANSTPADSNDDFWIDGDYHLKLDSPCIDTGDPNFILEPNETDLDGNPRVIGPYVDMGAYEALDPIDLLLDLTENVIDLELQKGIENSLLAKLDTALEKLEDNNENNDAAAINLLEAFINAVQAQRGKKIPEADADALIATAQQIIDLLSDE